MDPYLFQGGESDPAEARALLSPPMNALIVGTNKATVLDFLPDTFLLIDDGELIDRIKLPTRRAVTVFDVSKHSFNPVRGIDYRRARDFVAVLDAVFPEGEGTLTRKNSNFILLSALLEKPKGIDTLLSPKPTDSAHTDAYQKIQTILLSPVLSSVLTKPTNLSFRGTILARLNRAELGDCDCFVLASLLIAQYQGQVIIPDFGFYANASHTQLLRQNRLVAGVNTLSEVPTQREQLLLVDTKIASHCTAEDANTLAIYKGLRPGTNGYNQFIENCIS
jgi:hypothetical protein